MRMSLVKVALLCCTMLLSGAIYAHDAGRTPKERAEMQTRRMNKMLHLTPEQKGRVYQVNLNYARGIHKLADAGVDRKTQKRALRREKNADLRATLTGDQYALYREMQAAHRARMRERKHILEERTRN